MAEYRVEITIRESSEAVGFSVLQALERDCPETGPIMVIHGDALEYVLGTDAANAVEACAQLSDRFTQVLTTIGLDQLTIVGLHGDAVPQDELDEFRAAGLQPA
jgi:hypothetical protein